jgi:VCBS repeat-containing protein
VLSVDLDAAGDTLSATLDTTTAHGTLTLAANGSFAYTPATGFSGTDTFTYTPVGAPVGGVSAAGSPVTVTITVTASTGAPPPPPPPHPGLVITASGSVPPDAKSADVQQAALHPALPPDADDVAAAIDGLTADPLALAMDLLAIADPILLPDLTLPDFTLPGDEVAMLMLPATPEMAHLPEAIRKATKRLTQRAASHITFVDPVTGHSEADAAAIAHRTAHQSWLLVDTNAAVKPSRITWETA